ncbi:MAG: bifunctional 2',3'-cyclic-nucleotide 2'-phosphodiesterase/3'-nucleotidase [Symbiobacteriia bacterium]
MARSRLLAAVLTVLLVVGMLAPAVPALAAPTTANLVIMATTDMHGNIYPWDYFTNKSSDVGLAKISTLVKKVRADHPDALLFDNGDLIQGTPLDYYYAKVDPATATNVHPIIQVMNAMGYNASSIGNHEFNYGVPFLGGVIASAKFPYVSANVYKPGTQDPYFTPYTIIDAKVAGETVKVGVIGLTPPGIVIWDKANLDGVLETGDGVEAAKRFIPEMKAKGAQIIVALAHTGVDSGSSYDLSQAAPENFGADLANANLGIDLIVAGHSHRAVNTTINNTLIIQPANWGKFLAVATLSLEKTDNGWKVASATGELQSTKGDAVPADPEILDLVKTQHQAVVDYVNQVIGKTATPITSASARLADTAAVQAINDIQTARVKDQLKGTDWENLPVLSAAAPFKDNINIQPGDVTIADMASLYIYDNTLVAVKVTGAQLKGWLEHAAENFTQVTTPDAGNSPILNSKWAIYNFDQIDGVNYQIDITKPVGQRIVGLSYAGAPVTDTQEFVVATNNYRAGGGGNFAGTGKDAVKVLDKLEENRQLIIDTVKKLGTVSYFPDHNWSLTPNFINHWSAQYALDLINRGVLRGDATGATRLDQQVTRAEFATLLVRDLGLQPASDATPFTDLTGHWSATSVAAAYKAGLVNGLDATHFGPEAQVTRQEAATMLARAIASAANLSSQSDAVLAGYKDQGSIAAWARAALAFDAEHGVFAGDNNGNLRPADPMTRGEAAKILDVSVPEKVAPNQVKLTFLSLNDFHGHLAANLKARGGAEYGAARLTTAFLGEELGNPSGTVVVNAGDAYQGTPISNLTQGQSVNEWLNSIGTKAMEIGNHEFDWTVDVLKQRMADAQFPMLAANIYDTSTGKPVTWAKPYDIISVGGVKVGFVGLITPETADIVMPANIAGLKFEDPATVANTLVPQVRAAGADVIVLLTHIGATQAGANGVGEEIKDVIGSLTVPVDAVITGHSHTNVAALVPTSFGVVPVVQGMSYGKAYGKIDLVYDKDLKKVVNTDVSCVQPSLTIAENPAAAALVTKWNTAIGSKQDEVVGSVAAALTRSPSNAGEEVLGDMIADTQKNAVQAQIGFMNGGGIRSDLPAGDVTWKDLFTVQPFANTIYKANMTGAQIKEFLEEGVNNWYLNVSHLTGGHGPLQVSGLTFSWDFSKPMGERVDASSIKLDDGTVLDLTKTYVVAMNAFMATGGDSFTIMKSITDKVDTGIIDLDAMVNYFKSTTAPITYELQNRISVVNFPAK